jgi:hypothetical protein
MFENGNILEDVLKPIAQIGAIKTIGENMEALRNFSLGSKNFSDMTDEEVMALRTCVPMLLQAISDFNELFEAYMALKSQGDDDDGFTGFGNIAFN